MIPPRSLISAAIALLAAFLLPACSQAESDGSYRTASSSAGFDHSHQAFSSVLAAHLSKGKVDYASLKRKPGDLTAYLDTLAAVSKKDSDAWPKPQQMAFLILFCDADGSDDLTALVPFFAAAAAGHDLILGDRSDLPASRASFTWPQRFGNSLAGFLICLRWGHRFRDLGPLRLVRRSSLESFHMEDRGFGWTVEMQAKAAMLGRACVEIPVLYHRRKGGRSKIAGTLTGTVKAGAIILLTLAKLWARTTPPANPKPQPNTPSSP